MLVVYLHVHGTSLQCDLLNNGLNLQDQHENQSASKIRREGRTVPNLIYHVEDYERYLIQLSRITKVNLMRHAKRSTARDFKIEDIVKKKSRAVAHRSGNIYRGMNRGGAQPEPAEPEEEGEEPEEEREEEGENGDEERGEQVEEEELVNEEGVDEDETEENVAEDLEAEEIGAGEGDHEENDAVVADSDEEAVHAVPFHISESRHSRGSAPKRMRRVVASDDESDDEQPVSHQVSAKRQC